MPSNLHVITLIGSRKSTELKNDITKDVIHLVVFSFPNITA